MFFFSNILPLIEKDADENEARRVDFTPQAVITKQFLGEQFDPLPLNKIVDFLFMVCQH